MQRPPGPPQPEPDAGPQPPASRRRRLIARIAVAAGIVVFLGSVGGAASQLMPRRFSPAEQQQITNWDYAKRWRALAAGSIFPGTVSYRAFSPSSDDPALTLSARRLGIARQSTCQTAADPTAARFLDAGGCTALLRATYVDGTDSYVVTVGAAVLPGAPQAAAAAKKITAEDGKSGLGPAVHTVPFAGTPSAGFTNPRRQLSGVVVKGSYVVLYTVGYADARPREPVAGDSYADGEMTGAGTGVAKAVLAVLAAPVPVPRCPGAPGC
jgi:hypothetical protein